MKVGPLTRYILYTTTKLTKKDAVVIWRGTRDIGRNEAKKALQQISNFVQNHNQTNVIVMSAPHRHDLDLDSCVNKEVTVYNKKLKKHLKVFDNALVREVDPLRELYTRHGLHINQNGKEQMAKKIALAVKFMLQKKKSDPIVMFDEGHVDALTVVSKTKTIPKHDTIEPSNTQTNISPVSSNKVEPTPQTQPPHSPKESSTNENSIESKPNDRTQAMHMEEKKSNRTKKAPLTRSDDFLWM